jgi:hypothetical protein
LDPWEDAGQRWEEPGGDGESDCCNEKATNSASDARPSPQA